MLLSIAHYESPIGPIEIRATAEAVSSLDFPLHSSGGIYPSIGTQPTDGEAGASAQITAVPAANDPVQFDGPARSGAHPLLLEAQRQLAAYFAGELRHFDLPLAMEGTAFQRQVWQQLRSVEYGETASYQAVADAIGNPKAVRAVGAANGRNPVAIIVPCHRIIGSSRAGSGARPKLTGYGGGLWRKEWLLRHEGALLI